MFSTLTTFLFASSCICTAVGAEPRADEQVLQVAASLPNTQGVLVTAGENGAAFAFKDAAGDVFTGHVPVYDVAVQDTTGAGDAFTCGFLSFLLRQVCPSMSGWKKVCVPPFGPCARCMPSSATTRRLSLRQM